MNWKKKMHCQAPNRYILSISGLLVVFAISIGVAIIFPYQDDVVDDVVNLYETVDDRAESSSATVVDAASPEEVPLLNSDGDVGTDPVAGNQAGSSGAPHDAGTAVHRDEEKKEETVDKTVSQTEPQDETKHEETSAAAETVFKEEELSEGESEAPLHSESQQQGLFDHASEETPAAAEEATTCRTLLLQADVNSNHMIDTTEYLSFLHHLHASSIVHADNLPEHYSDLDFPLRINFLHQSCHCPQDMQECCEERNGIYIGSEELVDSVCALTLDVGADGKIGRSVGEGAKGLRGATR